MYQRFSLINLDNFFRIERPKFVEVLSTLNISVHQRFNVQFPFLIRPPLSSQPLHLSFVIKNNPQHKANRHSISYDLLDKRPHPRELTKNSQKLNHLENL